MSLIDQIKAAGVIGAGGAGFPTHVKLNATADYILMNAAECEPLLRVDQQLMKIYADDILHGFVKAGKQVEAKEAIIGIKKKHKEVIAHLHERIQALGYDDFVKIKEMADVYPAGDEQVLVYELTGRVVPEVGIPLQVGCVVINSETALNVQKASQGESVTETYVTLAGDIPMRKTFKVPVGMRIKDVLALSGINDLDEYAVIDGGPMMGPVLENLDGYIQKKSKGYVILKKTHPLIAKKTAPMEQIIRINKGACEQCRMCTDLCPRYLLGHNMQPHRVMTTLNYRSMDEVTQEMGFLCCQCGLCELFSCPCGLYPKGANMYFKNELSKQGKKYSNPNKTPETRPMRDYRLVPSKRLIARLGLYPYDKPAPIEDINWQPDEVHILLHQHVGKPASPIVQVGAHVNKGDCIGMIEGDALGANVHASISGTITEINDRYITIRRA